MTPDPDRWGRTARPKRSGSIEPRRSMQQVAVFVAALRQREIGRQRKTARRLQEIVQTRMAQ